MRIFIIGIGLIGGSFARAMKAFYSKAEVYGIDSSTDHLIGAKAMGIIDEIAEYDGLKSADIVLVAVPVDSGISVVERVLDLVRERTLVIEMGSTKARICNALAEHPRRKNFLAAHPIAGTEFSGPQAAVTDLFNGKTIILCEAESTDTELREKARDIFGKLGMKIRDMDPEGHDKHIAYVSHLSHISSFMLGKTVLEKEENESNIFDLAGSGFASTVRLAKSSPAMWAPIFRENKENVLESLKEYISNLKEFQELLENDDYHGLYQEMKRTNHIETILNGIKENIHGK